MSKKVNRIARLAAQACSLLSLSIASALAGPLEDLPPGQWYEVPASTMKAVDPCPASNCSWSGSEGQNGVIDDWGGGAFASRYGAKGSMIVFGGGHGGYFGNELYRFDVDTLKWSRASEPTANPVCDQGEGELQDQTPCSGHVYDFASYHPGTNSFVLLGSASNHAMGGGGSPRVHLFDFTSKAWRRGERRPTPGGLEGANSAYDPNRDVFWLWSSFNEGLYKYDPNGNGGAGAWTVHARDYIVIDGLGAIDPVHDLYVALEGRETNTVKVFDLKNPNTASINVTTTGNNAPQLTKYSGFEWDPVSQAFIAWIGGTDVYKLTPPTGNWKTDAWVWTRVPAAAGNTVTPSARNMNGTYGRWQYVPAVNAFIVVNSNRDNVYFYKLNNAPPIVDPTISLTADATSLGSGGNTTLRWNVSNSNTCTASNGWSGTKTTSGTQAIGPLTAASTVYTLTCTNTGGGIASQSVSVNVVSNPPPTISLTANPTSVASGGNSSLTWTVTGATSCTAAAGDASWSGAKASTGGTASVGPITSNRTYTISCTGTGGTSNASASVTVGNSAPSVQLSAAATSVAAGGTTTLTWSAANATSCMATGGWSGARATSGTETTPALSTSQTFTLTCSGANNSAAQNVTVTVAGTSPPPTSLASSGDSGGGGSMGLLQALGLLVLAFARFARSLRLRTVAALSLTSVISIGAHAADITTVTVVNTSGSAQTNVPVTFGQIFKPGDAPAASNITATIVSGGTVLPIQTDIKATHADGSTRHAIISLRVPSLASGASANVVISSAASGGSSGSAVTLQQLLATSFDATTTLTVAGIPYSASARTLLQAGTPTAWLSGPVVSEWIVGGPVRTLANLPHPHLQAYFHVRAYSNGAGGVGQVRVDCIVENGWTFIVAPSSFDYAATINVGGSNVYSNTFGGSNAPHYAHARWHKTFGWPTAMPAYAQLDTAYLRATKAMPNIGATTITATHLNSVLQSATPMSNGELTRYMGDTGAQEQIGPVGRWDADYLASGADVRAFRNVLANHDSAGSYSVHYRDETTGRPVSIGDRTRLSLQIPADFPVIGGTDNPNDADVAHQPSLGFVPYAVTGDYFYLEEMLFWTSWNQLWLNPDYRQNEKGIVHSQIRAQAWILRSLGQAAYLAPDSHPYKTHLKASIDANAAQYKSLYSDNPSGNALGAMRSYDGNLLFAMWQDDFLTWTMAYLTDLGFTSITPFRDWKFKFVVGRMSNNDYCYKHAAVNLVEIGTTDGTWFPDFTTFHNHNISKGKFPAESCADGGTLTLGYPDAPAGYFSNATPALAAAVEAGYPGASAAWTRLKGATPQPIFTDYPNWNVVPRSNPGSTAPQVTLSASPTTITAGASTTLSWTSVNSTSCVATGGWSGSKTTGSGSEVISNIAATTAYTLTCTGGGGPAAASTIQVSVGTSNPAPTATISANTTQVTSGGGATLTWSSANATACTASGAWTGSKATSGTQALTNLTSTGTYSLVCTGANGSSPMQNVTITVTSPATGGGGGGGGGTSTPPASSGDSGGGGAWGLEWLAVFLALDFARRRATSVKKLAARRAIRRE